MTEIWKEYKVYQGWNYLSTSVEISNLGNVRAGKVGRWNYKPFTEDMITIIDGRRYLGSKRIYHLVWELFNGKKPKGYDIHHKDFNKMNDCIDNLECLSKSEHQKIHRQFFEPALGHTYKPTEEVKLKISEAVKSAGLSEKFTGTRYYNNGIICVRRKDCPDGFVLGRLDRKTNKE